MGTAVRVLHGLWGCLAGLERGRRVGRQGGFAFGKEALTNVMIGGERRRRWRTLLVERVGADNPVLSCDLHVLVNEAAEPVSP